MYVQFHLRLFYGGHMDKRVFVSFGLTDNHSRVLMNISHIQLYLNFVMLYRDAFDSHHMPNWQLFALYTHTEYNYILDFL